MHGFPEPASGVIVLRCEHIRPASPSETEVPDGVFRHHRGESSRPHTIQVPSCAAALCYRITEKRYTFPVRSVAGEHGGKGTRNSIRGRITVSGVDEGQRPAVRCTRNSVSDNLPLEREIVSVRYRQPDRIAHNMLVRCDIAGCFPVEGQRHGAVERRQRFMVRFLYQPFRVCRAYGSSVRQRRADNTEMSSAPVSVGDRALVIGAVHRVYVEYPVVESTAHLHPEIRPCADTPVSAEGKDEVCPGPKRDI